MKFNTVDAFSIVFAAMVFTLFALATTFMASTLFYAIYKERKLRIPSAMPVLNLSAAGILFGVISGLFTLLFDVLQLHVHESSHLSHGVKCFVEEFSISAYFQALFFISATRYGMTLYGEKLCRVSMKQITAAISVTWVISAVYAAFVTFSKQQHGRGSGVTYPRGAASAQFAFLGFLQFGATCNYGNLVLYFHQKRDNLPPNFYSLESSSRRIAERNIRVSAKNIQMIALIVGTLCACHLPYIGVITAAMFTGQLSHNAKVFAVSIMQCGLFMNLILYGYLNKRFKRIVRPMLHRLIDRITNNNRRRKINELFSQNNLSISSSRTSFNSFRDNYELTRSKLAFLYR